MKKKLLVGSILSISFSFHIVIMSWHMWKGRNVEHNLDHVTRRSETLNCGHNHSHL